MSNNLSRLFARFSRYGVLRREEVKNDLAALHSLVRAGLVQRAMKSGRVFYELTEQSLPLLEQQRRILLEELRLRSLLDPRLVPLTDDVRFLDEQSPEADVFRLLGDWQLKRSVVASQLELAKLRFFRERVPERTRRVANPKCRTRR